MTLRFCDIQEGAYIAQDSYGVVIIRYITKIAPPGCVLRSTRMRQRCLLLSLLRTSRRLHLLARHLLSEKHGALGGSPGDQRGNRDVSKGTETGSLGIALTRIKKCIYDVSNRFDCLGNKHVASWTA